MNKLLTLTLYLFALSVSGTSFKLGETYYRHSVTETETAVKSFKPANGQGPEVTLLAEIHSAKKSYFRQIQEYINSADIILSEGVVAIESDFFDERCPGLWHFILKSGNFIPHRRNISEMQYRPPAHELVSGLEELKYPQPGTIVADINFMSLIDEMINTQFAKNIQANWGVGEWLTLRFGSKCEQVNSLIRNAHTKLPIGSEVEPFPGFDDVMIERRNDIVLNMLKNIVKSGMYSRILIIHGFAHMADIEKRFTERLHYVPFEEKWLTAISF